MTLGCVGLLIHVGGVDLCIKRVSVIQNILLVVATVIFPSVTTAEDLDVTYFGLEFRDSRDAVQISWIDLNHKTAQKLRIGDVVLSAGELQFDNAGELTELLQSQDSNRNIRFEVLALTDQGTRKVSIRPETVRESVRRRFTKHRDRGTQETLYVPKFPPTQLHVAVGESFDGSRRGFRLRFYPKSSSAAVGYQILFWKGSLFSSSNSGAWLPTKTEEFKYSNLSEDGQKKLPTLSPSQMGAVNRAAYVELGLDRTTELLDVFNLPAAERQNIGYLSKGSRVLSGHRLTGHEQRNIQDCILLYQVLTEPKERPAEAKK